MFGTVAARKVRTMTHKYMWRRILSFLEDRSCRMETGTAN